MVPVLNLMDSRFDEEMTVCVKRVDSRLGVFVWNGYNSISLSRDGVHRGQLRPNRENKCGTLVLYSMKWNFSLPTFFRHKSLLLWWFLKAKLILKHKVELEGNYRLTLKKRKGEKKTFSQENIPHQIRMEGGPSSFLTFDLKIKEVFSPSRGRQLVTKTLSFQNEDFLYGTPKNILSFLFLGERYLGKAKKKGLLFNRPRTYRATRFYKSTWGDQLRRSFSLFFWPPSYWPLPSIRPKMAPLHFVSLFFPQKLEGTREVEESFVCVYSGKRFQWLFLSPHTGKMCFCVSGAPKSSGRSATEFSPLCVNSFFISIHVWCLFLLLFRIIPYKPPAFMNS